MDIPSLSISMAQSSVMQAVNVSVLKMAVDMSNQQSQQLTQMMERSVTPNLGGNFDLRA
ncbi:YjfB family protein [Paenibacillus sacheonensis]|uniref:Putative motility protein n=1 Tax=Paenibacillus sacheonensis TaxID=742054 RepID=A0A7X5BWR8_9BACL|nr:YjfB family protein [Paenibacillus sacheonensis]MBM7563833.1 hypothetical protein [Paenibacillus sacheonensis]NBC67817.1 putative motility protein [Paenibacillus sacheonensis]